MLQFLSGDEPPTRRQNSAFFGLSAFSSTAIFALGLGWGRD